MNKRPPSTLPRHHFKCVLLRLTDGYLLSWLRLRAFRKSFFFILLHALVSLHDALPQEVGFLVSDGALVSYFAYQKEAEEKALLFVIKDDINIVWGLRDSDNLVITPLGDTLSFKYKILIEGGAADADNMGTIKMDLTRSPHNNYLDFFVGFFYNYSEAIEAGIKFKGVMENKEEMDISIKPSADLTLGRFMSVSLEADVLELLQGNIRNVFYINISFTR